MREYALSALEKAQLMRSQDPEFSRLWDGMRGFCRAEDGVSGRDHPVRRPFYWNEDWLFQSR